MFHLKTLGTPSVLSVNGGPGRSIVTRPKCFAVLTYLASSQLGELHQRDSLLALFWPESSLERARNSLRQTLHILRDALDASIIVTHGRTLVGVDHTLLRYDVRDFKAALADSRPADALERYSGDFLDGFFIRRAPGFERWSDEQRYRLRGLAQRATKELAEAKGACGELEAAIVAWIRAHRLAPYDETVMRGLIVGLLRAGRRAEALQRYHAFVARRQADLGLLPSSAMSGFIRHTLGTSSARIRPGVDTRQRPWRHGQPLSNDA